MEAILVCLSLCTTTVQTRQATVQYLRSALQWVPTKSTAQSPLPAPHCPSSPNQEKPVKEFHFNTTWPWIKNESGNACTQQKVIVLRTQLFLCPLLPSLIPGPLQPKQTLYRLTWLKVHLIKQAIVYLKLSYSFIWPHSYWKASNGGGQCSFTCSPMEVYRLYYANVVLPEAWSRRGQTPEVNYTWRQGLKSEGF